MSGKKNYNLGLILGIIGTVSGILLITMGRYFIGVFGSIASAGLAYQSYINTKKEQSSKDS